jgi:hypothetical protein
MKERPNKEECPWIEFKVHQAKMKNEIMKVKDE